MARCLIIGCGCRGRALAGELRERGHIVRGTTRDPATMAVIEGAGAEAHLGDPDRLMTIVPAFAHVSVAYILLGSATGPVDSVRALHETRLETMLYRMLDTTIHGIVYEAAGTVDSGLLAAGAVTVKRACDQSRIPFGIITADPADHAGWVGHAADQTDHVLRPR
jgi:3-hydroxyisobutyrate dehydrogenase-like beta-hydroxyacid dehydrogenase